jgi:hypothetical protein
MVAPPPLIQSHESQAIMELTAVLICGACYEDGESDGVIMLAEPGEDAGVA